MSARTAKAKPIYRLGRPAANHPAPSPPATAASGAATAHDKPEPEARFVTVTPEMAELWLKEKNVKNRAIRDSYTVRLSHDMKAGKWRGRNGESIRFDTEGRLVDGQHRLRACVIAGIPFETLLVTGIDPDDYRTIDIGARKSMADFLGPMYGEKNAILLASSLRIVHMWQHGSLVVSQHYGAEFPTIADMEDVYLQHPALKESVHWVASHRDVRNLLTPTYGVLIHYAGTLEHKNAVAVSFLERLGSGLGLLDTDPVYHLRSFLLSQRGPAPDRRRAGRTYNLALTIKAWLASKNEQPMRSLTFKTGEAFPQL